MQFGALVAILGRGSFSNIYCYKTSGGDLVAVKSYKKDDIGSNANRVKRLLIEKQILLMLNNLHVPMLHYTDQDEEYLHYVMEPMLGGSLHLHIKESRKLPRNVAAVYTSHITSALLYLASAGVVHRDIKASNCVLDGYGRIKLCDFNSAKLFEYNASFDMDYSIARSNSIGHQMGLPVTYTLLGTRHCMAPEMISNMGYSFSVDWWGLGVLLFEMLTGHPPSNVGLQTSEEFEMNGLNLTQEDRARQVLSMTMVSEDSLCTHGWWLVTYDMEPWTESSDLLTRASQDFLTRLLQPNVLLRYGPREEEKIQTHEFFSSIDWLAVKSCTDTLVMFNKDIGYLHLLQPSTCLEENEEDVRLTEEQQQLFKDF